MAWLQLSISEEEKEIIREEAEADRRTMVSLILSIVMPELERRRHEREHATHRLTGASVQKQPA